MAVDPYIQALLDSPIGARHIQQEAGNPEALLMHPEAIAAAKRAQKIWLPDGKKSANTREARDAARAARALNYDLEDAVEQAGGARGNGSR